MMPRRIILACLLALVMGPAAVAHDHPIQPPIPRCSLPMRALGDLASGSLRDHPAVPDDWDDVHALAQTEAARADIAWLRQRYHLVVEVGHGRWSLYGCRRSGVCPFLNPGFMHLSNCSEWDEHLLPPHPNTARRTRAIVPLSVRMRARQLPAPRTWDDLRASATPDENRAIDWLERHYQLILLHDEGAAPSWRLAMLRHRSEWQILPQWGSTFVRVEP